MILEKEMQEEYIDMDIFDNLNKEERKRRISWCLRLSVLLTKICSIVILIRLSLR